MGGKWPTDDFQREGMTSAVIARPSLARIVAYFFRLGCTGFGGPVALANYMRSDLVERYGWIDRQEYDEGLAIATACPGPLAYQLGVYCGYLTHGVAGAIAIAVAFALGPFLIVCAAGYLYVRFGSNWVLRGLFYGIGPVVVALIFKSCWDLGKKTLRSERLAWAFAIIACIITLVVQKEVTFIFLAAGVLGVFLFVSAARPAVGPTPTKKVAKTLLPPADMLAATTTIVQAVGNWKIFVFFFQTGFLVFGSGLVIVPFLKAYVVDEFHWLADRPFLDAVAIGIISPGPVVITATFVGYLLNSFPGAAAATLGMFLPSVIFVVLGTPILRRYRTNPRVQGFIRGVTVAVVGVLVGTAFIVAKSAIGDWPTALLLAACIAAVLFARKIPDQLLVAGGAIAGLVLYPLVRPEWILK